MPNTHTSYRSKSIKIVPFGGKFYLAISGEDVAPKMYITEDEALRDAKRMIDSGKFANSAFSNGQSKAQTIINQKMQNVGLKVENMGAAEFKKMDTSILKVMLDNFNKQATRAKLVPNELAMLHQIVAELKSRGETV